MKLHPLTFSPIALFACALYPFALAAEESAVTVDTGVAAEAAPVMSIRSTVETIDRVDQAYREREAEVLNDAAAVADPVAEPPPPPPPVQVISLAPAAAASSQETAAAPSVVAPAAIAPELVPIPSADVLLEFPTSATAAADATAEAETISVDFPDEDVREIVRSVADLYLLNVVIPATLEGRVTLKLRDVTWQQVFGVVLEPLQHAYVVDRNIIKIMSREDIALEPVDTRVFVIDFAVAQEISSSVTPLVDAAFGGQIQVDRRSNALIITERPSRMNAIQEIIDSLDRPTEQVMIESKFVEILIRDNRNIGVDWSSLAGMGVQLGPFQREYEGTRGSNRDNRTLAGDSFTQTNVSPGQLFIEESNILERARPISQITTDTAVFSAEAFRMVISALESNTDVELVSNPTVVTMNNTPAQINIGEEFPIPDYTYNQERGTFEISGFEYKPIGINLEVTPQINSAGFINLHIQPEISSRSGEVGFGGASGTLVPIISTRKTNSTVSIKSGYTLAIGGLIEKTTERTDSKVPVLGSIPVFGRMFSSAGRTTDERNLIIFITAKILSASGATYRDVFSQRTLYEMGIKSRDLPGYEPPPTERELFDAIQRSRDDIEALQTEAQLRRQLDAFNSVRGKRELDVQRQKGNIPQEREVPRRGR